MPGFGSDSVVDLHPVGGALIGDAGLLVAGDLTDDAAGSLVSGALIGDRGLFDAGALIGDAAKLLVAGALIGEPGLLVSRVLIGDSILLLLSGGGALLTFKVMLFDWLVVTPRLEAVASQESVGVLAEEGPAVVDWLIAGDVLVSVGFIESRLLDSETILGSTDLPDTTELGAV